MNLPLFLPSFAYIDDDFQDDVVKEPLEQQKGDKTYNLYSKVTKNALHFVTISQVCPLIF